MDRGTFALLRRLRGYYNPEIGVPEQCDPGTACYSAQEAFLDVVMETGPMRALYPFLRDRGREIYQFDLFHFFFHLGLAATSAVGFRREIRQYFFKAYSRSDGAAKDSSGFEHVFLGEVRDKEVTGFHNWVVAYIMEQQTNEFRLSKNKGSCEVSFQLLCANNRV